MTSLTQVSCQPTPVTEPAAHLLQLQLLNLRYINVHGLPLAASSEQLRMVDTGDKPVMTSVATAVAKLWTVSC